MISTLCRVGLLAAAVVSFAARAQRPDEGDLFGAADAGVADAGVNNDHPDEGSMFGDPAKTPGSSPVESGSKSESSSKDVGKPSSEDQAGLTSVGQRDAFATGEAGASDPLRIGGQFYERFFLSKPLGTPFSHASISAPTLVDAYLDARPNERVRAFVLGRLSYDPTLTANGTALSSVSSLGSTSFSPLSTSTNPAVVLDQAWLRFDIDRKIFVTVGQQHVRWGTGRYWSPTDFLTPQLRNPLLPFDPRVGASMVKLHLPVESLGWNFYAIGLLDNSGPASLLGQVGGALRAEALLGTVEVGIDGVVQAQRHGRAGVDFSAPIGLFDVYGEVALKSRSDVQLLRFPNNTPVSSGHLSVEAFNPTGLTPAATLGATVTLPYLENNTITIGAEYFYNRNGYKDPRYYPALIFCENSVTGPALGCPQSTQGQQLFQPFYLGQHYAALYALAAPPWDKNHTTFVLSNLGNLSDKSFVSRLDYSVRVLTHLTLEAFVAYHYGSPVGEFNLGFQVPQVSVPSGFPGGSCQPSGDPSAPPSCTFQLQLPPPQFELGVGARIAI